MAPCMICFYISNPRRFDLQNPNIKVGYTVYSSKSVLVQWICVCTGSCSVPEQLEWNVNLRVYLIVKQETNVGKILIDPHTPCQFLLTTECVRCFYSLVKKWVWHRSFNRRKYLQHHKLHNFMIAFNIG